MTKAKVAVIGAGIGGLTAALALGREGFGVRVYEQSPELREVGAGVSLSPNATRVLDHLGLGEALRACSLRPQRQAIKHYRSGETLVEFERGALMRERYGADYLQTHRADLHGLLLGAVEALDPDAVETGREAVRVDPDTSRPAVHFADGSRVEADVVIGADGIRSLMRQSLFGADRPSFAHYIAWRGLVPVERLGGVDLEPTSAVYVGPGNSFARYLVRDGRLVNYVAFAERAEWAVEGWSVPSEIAELAAEFVGWHEDVLTIIGETPPERCYKWGLFAREPLTAWSRGTVTLLGDAAHPMLPFMGQGAAMAIEDAMVLARALATEADAATALARYEGARRPRTTFAQEQSAGMVKRFHAGPGRPGQWKNHRTEETMGLFDYDAVAVAI